MAQPDFEEKLEIEKFHIESTDVMTGDKQEYYRVKEHFEDCVEEIQSLILVKKDSIKEDVG